MAIGRDTTAENIKPLEGAIVRRRTAGATITAGMLCAGMADGYVDPANASTFTGTMLVGVALQSVASGQRVDIVTGGPVKSITGGTPHALVYASNTAGQVAETVGTKGAIAGYVESATVLFVRPRLIDLI